MSIKIWLNYDFGVHSVGVLGIFALKERKRKKKTQLGQHSNQLLQKCLTNITLIINKEINHSTKLMTVKSVTNKKRVANQIDKIESSK